MRDNWQKIYSHWLEHKVEIAQAILKEEDIDSVIMDKKDSAYHFGEVELYVQADNVLQAKQILNKESL